MASIVVSGDTSGAVTLEAPAIAGTTTLTLPTTSGTLVVTGGAQTVQFAAGSAAAPSITFTGDTNTGIFSPAADTIAFSEGGAESMRIDTSGNVQVGGTTSRSVSGYRFLSVLGTGAYTDYYSSTTRIGSIGCEPSSFNLDAASTNPMTFSTNGSERMRIDSSGNVNIATAGVYLRFNSASSTFDLSGQAGATDFLRINANGTQRFQFNTAGQAYNSTGTWGTISDARLKENIADATPKLDSLNQLRVVNFNFKDEPDVKQIGFIAQEVEQVFPGLVSEGADDGEGGYYKAVKTTVLIPMLVKAMQELNAKVEAQAAEIAALKGVK